MTYTPPFPSLRVSAVKPPITLDHQAVKFSIRAVPLILMVLLVASGPTVSAQEVTYAGSGAVNFGTANVCPSGKTAPAPCSKTLTLTYNVTASGTLGTPLALTTGAPDLDYKLASGSTCVGSVTKGSTCTVNVIFAPRAPGERNGAVEVVDGSGKVLASVYIYGTGTGPAIAFNLEGALNWFGDTFYNINGVAVDASGNIFVADSYVGVQEILAAGGYKTVNSLNSGLGGPYDVALDGAGNVFVAIYGNLPGAPPAVREILRAGGYTTVRTLSTGFSFPRGIAVDGSGNVFVTDSGNKAVKELLAAGGYTTGKTLGSGFDYPFGLAVDGAGNVFVADYLGQAVKEITAASGYTAVKTVGSGFYAPTGVAVDASGNVYVSDVGSNLVSEIVADGGYTTVNTLANISSLGASSIALDSGGNLYFTAGECSCVNELPRSQPPSFAFGATDVGTTSPSSPISTTIQNIGNADLVGSSISVSPNWDLVAGSGTLPDCTASLTLVPGAECNLSISFEPLEAGNLTGAVTLDATQSIPLSGTGVNPVSPEITSLSTTYGAPYSVVIVNGTNFGATQGASTVTFNGVATPHYYWANTQIYVTVPPNATTGSLVVTVGGKASNGVAFTVVPQPKVTGISPTSGPVGTVVTISGTNLLDYGDKGTVTFNGKLLAILSQSSTALKVAVPTGAVSGDFHVVVNDTGINTSSFTVTP